MGGNKLENDNRKSKLDQSDDVFNHGNAGYELFVKQKKTMVKKI